MEDGWTIPEGYIKYSDAPFLFDKEGVPYLVWIEIPDISQLSQATGISILQGALAQNMATGEVVEALKTFKGAFSGLREMNPYNLMIDVAYESLTNAAVESGLPQHYLNYPDVMEWFGLKAANVRDAPEIADAFSMGDLVDTPSKLVDDPAFARQLKASGQLGEIPEGFPPEGRVTGGGGYEPGLTGSPIKFAEELGKGIVTPTSATVVAKTREEAEKLGATWWIPDTPELRESYTTQKAYLEDLLAQNYSMEQTPDEAARGFAVSQTDWKYRLGAVSQQQATPPPAAGAYSPAGGIPFVPPPAATVQPTSIVQVGAEPPSLTGQFSAPVITQREEEWTSLKKKARSAQMASNKQWRVGL